MNNFKFDYMTFEIELETHVFQVFNLLRSQNECRLIFGYRLDAHADSEDLYPFTITDENSDWQHPLLAFLLEFFLSDKELKLNWLDLAGELENPLREGDLDEYVKRVSEAILGMPVSSFHLVLQLDFNNDPSEIANHFETFFQKVPAEIELKAIYAEMNGFYINPDRWYFELFGYKSYGGHDNYNWLAFSDTSYAPTVTLTGMEMLQKVYIEESRTSSRVKVRDYADLLVVLRFQQLISRSVKHMQKVTVPILATAHDYDFISETKPQTGDKR